MLVILAIVLGGIAAVAWLVAVYSAVRIVRMVPAGSRGRAARFVARWQFGALRPLGGDGVVKHANCFIQSVLLLAGVIVVAVALGASSFIDAQSATPSEMVQPVGPGNG
jgi:hypothetical protein